MAEEMTTPTPTSSETLATPPEPSPWQNVGRRARNTRPVTLARYALVIGGFAVLFWLANTAWQSIVPFVVGGFIAYAVLPFVNRLDRIMPRWLASLLAVIGVLAFIVLFLATLVPIIVNQVFILINGLPNAEQIAQGRTQLDVSMSHLPVALRTAINQFVTEAGQSYRASLDNFIKQLPQVTVTAVFGLINTISAVLGLLVLPTWLLTVLKDGKQGVRAINRLLPARTRLDFWSIVRIIDRSLRAFLQQQVTQAFLVGVGIAVVAWVIDRVGIVDVKYPLAAGLIIGTLELIPEIGPIIVYILLVLAGAGHGWPPVIIYVGSYFLIRKFVGQFVEARVGTHVKEPHAAIMALLAIMLSQIGFVYALLSVPIITMARDLFRYGYGRLSDPPRPAGLLPDDPRPIAPPEQQVLIKLRKPMVYRRMSRQPGRSAAPRPTNRSGVS